MIRMHAAPRFRRRHRLRKVWHNAAPERFPKDAMPPDLTASPARRCGGHTSRRTGRRGSTGPCIVVAVIIAASGAQAFAQASAAPYAVAKAEATYSAAFVSQTVPASLELFKPASISITMRNTGTQAWLAADGDIFLASQEPQDNYYWCIQDNAYGIYSGNRVRLPHDVAPDEMVTFDFVVKPLSCGFTATPPFRFRMLSSAHGTFGEETPAPQVIVSTDAEFASQQVPKAAPAGASIAVSVTFKNTSITTWTPEAGYSLGSAAPAANNRWGVTSVPLTSEVAPGGLATFEFPVVTPTTPATYNFQWQMNRPGNVPFGQASPATALQIVEAGPPNYGGLWWAAPAGSESGWGLNLAHQGATIFATWFTYDAAGKARWFAMTAGETRTAGTFTGALFTAVGPAFDAPVFRPDQVRSVAVGSGTLVFGEDTATFTYTVNGETQSKVIARQAFGPLPTCTFALVNDLAQATNYQDIWWAAPAGSESGWGVNLTQQGKVIFATWFTYDHDNSPMWLSAIAPRGNDGAFSGTLYRTTGPPFDSVPFAPAQVTATAVGTASFTFSDGASGTFAYEVDGIAGTKPITRQILESPGTICQ
jgi:hypothetical protein